MGQAAFITAALDASQPNPKGLVAPDGSPAGKRFDVYRNNIAVSLTEALETGFPVVCKLVGEAFFKAMAGVFLRAHPPSSPVLARYGDALPGFLESFPPAASLPYLPDIARLELAMRRAYHAADPAPFDPQILAELPPERLMRAVLYLADGVQVIASPYPIHSIWRANSEADAPPPGREAECVLITRPGFDPVATPVFAATAAFVRALTEGKTLEMALTAAQNADPEFDLTATLGLLLSQQALTGLTERSDHE
ncbi:MAG: DNA-binding domain-containing protein [Mangrovicoccus sp.]|nr:DNA-binding domain-containing protein [Mangrovicoccus sp.]